MGKHSYPLPPVVLAVVVFSGVCRITGRIVHAIIITGLLLVAVYLAES